MLHKLTSTLCNLREISLINLINQDNKTKQMNVNYIIANSNWVMVPTYLEILSSNRPLANVKPINDKR